MYIYLLILRLLHISCGVFWAGTAMFLAFYVFPAVIKAGPDGPKIMQAIMGTKMPTVMTFISFITVLTGTLLMWNLSQASQPVGLLRNTEWHLQRVALRLLSPFSRHCSSIGLEPRVCRALDKPLPWEAARPSPKSRPCCFQFVLKYFYLQNS